MVNAAIQAQIDLSPTRAEEFTNLLNQSYRKVFDMAYKLSHNRQDAEDLTQEACFRAYRGFDRFEGDRPFANWMYRIVTRLYLDQLRLRQRRAQEISLDAPLRVDKEGLPLFDPVDTGRTPEEELLTNTIDSDLLEAMNYLSPDQRELVRLVDLEGFESQEIAKLSSTPRSTVRSRLFRAHRVMRSRLTSRLSLGDSEAFQTMS